MRRFQYATVFADLKKGATIGACRIAPSIPDGMHCDIEAKAGQHKANK